MSPWTVCIAITPILEVGAESIVCDPDLQLKSCCQNRISQFFGVDNRGETVKHELSSYMVLVIFKEKSDEELASITISTAD